MQQTCLVLADGTVFSGFGYGLAAPTVSQLEIMSLEEAPCGEVVFNTTMGAYQEIFTDPSYAGQIITMTSPHIGNYGLDPAWNEMSLDRPACRGIVVRDLYDGPVPPGRTHIIESLQQWNICAVSELDTRSLAVHVRKHGACYGVCVRPDGSQAALGVLEALGTGKIPETPEPQEFLHGELLGNCHLSEHEKNRVLAWLSTCTPMEERDLITPVAATAIQSHSSHGSRGMHMVLVDYGVKRSILRELLSRGVDVTVVPPASDLEKMVRCGVGAGNRPVDAVFLSNGPGDPAYLQDEIMRIRRVIGNTAVLGICLGHQLIAHALGGKTEKHPFGHHGGNHPVRDTTTGRVFVTAQNHGYCVIAESLPKSSTVWFVNANDSTVEGLYDVEHAVMSIQFHPEASPGPREGTALFDTFIEFARNHSERQNKPETAKVR